MSNILGVENGRNIFNPTHQNIASTSQRYNKVHNVHTSPIDSSGYDEKDISDEDNMSTRLEEAPQSIKQKVRIYCRIKKLSVIPHSFQETSFYACEARDEWKFP